MAAERRLDARAIFGEHPIEDLAGVRREVIDAAVRGQFIRMMRLPMRGNIGWRGASAELELAHAARNQGGVLEIAAPHRAVDALLD